MQSGPSPQPREKQAPEAWAAVYLLTPEQASAAWLPARAAAAAGIVCVVLVLGVGEKCFCVRQFAEPLQRKAGEKSEPFEDGQLERRDSFLQGELLHWSAKRPAGLGSVLNRISGKKQKMSTLEKSRLDWDTFKTEEGIGDELATHNRGKDGAEELKLPGVVSILTA
ncbi:hypothetical protein JZ751_017005 [Albula glossodonta]|uniref:Craniofacial development protein 1 n=1 Tax=Albula glossodonta TaxID=121402 RepID=A0A8T2MQ25_9TELE|nr:hypothetical protein JZ751_017005 [Albula glossodonta]